MLATTAVSGAPGPTNSDLTGGILPNMKPRLTAANGGLMPLMNARAALYMWLDGSGALAAGGMCDVDVRAWCVSDVHARCV